MKINEPIIHDTHHPVEASARPDNAYYLHGCEIVERSPAYASCLYKISEQEAGRVHELHGECSRAHGNKCAARGMRDQEKLAGAALFYFPRKGSQARTLSVKVTGEFGVPITNLTDPALIPRDPPAPGRGNVYSKPAKTVDPLEQALAGADMASVITAEVAKLATPPNTTTFPHTGPVPTPQPLGPFTPPKEQLVMPCATPARPSINPGETPLQYARRLAALKNPT